MPSASDFPAIGQVMAVDDQAVVFQPLGTRYGLRLKTASEYGGAVGQRIEGLIRAVARKLITVPSGGNFVAPIVGPPRTIQGRIVHLDEKQMVVQAGTPFIVELPAEDDAIELTHGPLAVGALVNVALLPSPRFVPLVRAPL